MSVSTLVTVLGSTVTVLGAAGAAPPREPCLSWLPALPVFADAELVVVVVVVVVVGAVLPLELHATDSTPTATAATPAVNGALLRTCAMVDGNGISLSSQSYDVTVRFIPTWT